MRIEAMKILIRLPGLLFFVVLQIMIISSCIKKPDVLTSEVTDITETYAVAGGSVLDDGGSDVTDSGICWSTSENPAIDGNLASGGSGTVSFIIRLTGLSPDTKYFVRAYATNSAGTGYGNQVSFLTGEITLPGVLTTSVSGIDLTTASSGGFIYDYGGGKITEKGVCWSKSNDPTILDNRTFDDYITYPQGGFTSILTGLEPRTQYHVRAYATNDAGTSYGSEITFTTLSVNLPTFNPDLTYGNVTDIDGNIYKTIQIGTGTWMAENLKTTRLNDGSEIISYSNWVSGSFPAMFWFNDDPGMYKDIYGGYYNIQAVNTEKLCPEGWHVPDKSDWSQLISFLGNEGSAGGKMKESGTLNWMSPNYGATNESGYTGLPGGYRRDKFLQRGISSFWWSATANHIYSGTYNDSYVLDYKYKSIRILIMSYSRAGLNVRCVQD
jgi:uncharacterized protein (TIGR02145 family)